MHFKKWIESIVTFFEWNKENEKVRLNLKKLKTDTLCIKSPVDISRGVDSVPNGPKSEQEAPRACILPPIEEFSKLMNHNLSLLKVLCPPSIDSHGQQYANFEVVKVLRLSSEELFERYNFFKSHIRKEIPEFHQELPTIQPPVELHSEQFNWLQELIPVDSSINECILLHCPNQNPDVLDHILKSGLDPRYTRSGLFGRAAYFAESAVKCDEYAALLEPFYAENVKANHWAVVQSFLKDKILQQTEFNYLKENPSDSQQEKRQKMKKIFFAVRFITQKQDLDQVYSLLACRVALGFFHKSIHPSNADIDPVSIAHNQGVAPPHPKSSKIFHSVIGDCRRISEKTIKEEDQKSRLLSFREFMVYDRSQSYPEILIQYKRIPSPNFFSKQELNCLKKLKSQDFEDALKKMLFSKYPIFLQPIYENYKDPSLKPSKYHELQDKMSYFVEPRCQATPSESSTVEVFQVFYEFLAEPKSIGKLLKGDSGTGKSSVLFKFQEIMWEKLQQPKGDEPSLKFQYLNESHENKFFIPFWISLTDFSKTFEKFDQIAKTHYDPSGELKTQNYYYWLISKSCRMGDEIMKLLFCHYNLLLLMDGFDESGWPENTSFYEKTKLFEFCRVYHSKFIISCRNQFLSRIPNAERVYFNLGSRGDSIILSPFDQVLITKAIEKFYKRNQEQIRWKPKQILEKIGQNYTIAEALHQPLLLWMALQVFSSVEDIAKITRNKLYFLVLKWWFERENEKLQSKSNSLKELKDYSSSLAWQMYIEGKSEAEMPFSKDFKDIERTKPIRFVRKEETFDMKDIAVFSFIHKSFQEYLVALIFFQEIASFRKHGNEASFLNTPRKFESPRKRLIHSEPGVVEFLKEMIEENKERDQLLINLLDLSQLSKPKKENSNQHFGKDFSIASANALSIYIATGRSLNPVETVSHLDFSESSLSGVDLRNSCFVKCNFRGADLANALLSHSVFSECIFIETNLENADFGQAPPFELKVTKNQTYASCSLKGRINTVKIASNELVMFNIQNLENWWETSLVYNTENNCAYCIKNQDLVKKNNFTCLTQNPFNTNLYFQFNWKTEMWSLTRDDMLTTIEILHPDDLIWLNANSLLTILHQKDQVALKNGITFIQIESHDFKNIQFDFQNPQRMKADERGHIYVSSIYSLAIFKFNRFDSKLTLLKQLYFSEIIKYFEFDQNYYDHFAVASPSSIKIFTKTSFTQIYELNLQAPDFFLLNGFEIITFNQGYKPNQSFSHNEHPFIFQQSFFWDLSYPKLIKPKDIREHYSSQEISEFFLETYEPLFFETLLWTEASFASPEICISSPLCQSVSKVFYDHSLQSTLLVHKSRSSSYFKFDETKSRWTLQWTNEKMLVFQNCCCLNTKIDPKNTPLLEAHQSWFCETAVQELQLVGDSKMNLNLKENRNSNLYNQIAINFASKKGNAFIVKKLLQAGFSCNTRDESDETPLHLACINGHKKVVSILLNNGCDANARDRDEKTALHRAAENGQVQIIQILLEKGCDINAQDKNQETALHCAAKNDHFEALCLLIKDKRLLINAKNQNGITPLMIVCQMGFQETANQLLQVGANPDIQEKNGWTALMFALQSGHRRLVSLLLEKNAQITIQTKDGLTALDWAHAPEMLEIIQKYK